MLIKHFLDITKLVGHKNFEVISPVAAVRIKIERDQIRRHQTRRIASGVASPKLFWKSKNFGGEIFILGEHQSCLGYHLSKWEPAKYQGSSRLQTILARNFLQCKGNSVYLQVKICCSVYKVRNAVIWFMEAQCLAVKTKPPQDVTT